MAQIAPTAALPGATRYDIPAFIADLEAVAAHTTAPQALAAAAAERLTRLLATPDLLPADCRQPDAACYCPHLVAVAPSGAFSIVALVWLPGQATRIHDHIAWCVVGVLEGVEAETRYHLLADAAGDRWLTPGVTEMMAHGAVAQLIPPDENIHQVRNAGETLAISLHIYGANLDTIASHSSINQCFDDLPIRDDRHGTPIPWRAHY